MTLEERLVALAVAMGTDIKTLTGAIGNLNTLQTSAKNSLVAAINELRALLLAAGTGGAGIDDSLTTSTTKTYSIDKILAVTNKVKQDILGGVPSELFDTLKEIADYLVNDKTAAGQIVAALGLRVRVDESQNFNNDQKAQARENIGALGVDELGDPDTDFVTAYNTAKA